jgi:hypothetical protein
MSRPLCPHATRYGHKQTFPSEVTAKAAALFHCAGAYKCRHCEGWHLTSQGRKTKSRRAAARKARRKLGSYNGLK